MSIEALNEIKKHVDAAHISIGSEKLELCAVTLDELLKKELPPREYFLEPWLPKSGLCMVYAKRGIGKTFFALEIAMTIAAGGKFLSYRAPQKAKVLYVDGEMPANAMQERLANIQKRLNIHPEMIDLSIITPDLQDGVMPNISTIEGQEALSSLVEKADLIIFDNLSTLGSSGKENEAESWAPIQAYVLGIRKHGKSVLFIHHAGKNGSQRGTSKREDILDTVITLKQPSNYQPSDGARFEVHFEKARGIVGDAITPVSCKLTENGWVAEPIGKNNYQLVLEHAKNGLIQSEIVSKIGISKGQVSKLYNEALKNGDLIVSK